MAGPKCLRPNPNSCRRRERRSVRARRVGSSTRTRVSISGRPTSSATWIPWSGRFSTLSVPRSLGPPLCRRGNQECSACIRLDTDHLGWDVYVKDATLSRAWVWKSFLRGHNPILMEDLKNNSGWIAARAAMGHTRTYANKMNLAAMTPQNGLSKTSYCLANSGQEYLVYQAGSGAFSVNPTAESYAFEWFNPTTGAVASTGSVKAAGGNQIFTPPFSGPAVLYLKAASRRSKPRAVSSVAAKELALSKPLAPSVAGSGRISA